MGDARCGWRKLRRAGYSPFRPSLVAIEASYPSWPAPLYGLCSPLYARSTLIAELFGAASAGVSGHVSSRR